MYVAVLALSLNLLTLTMIQFVNARGNQRWNCFKSDKVAEISYASELLQKCLTEPD
jgi:hypothetical protein